MKDYRNRAVHGGEDNLNIEILIYQLKRFVEALLEFQIWNKYGFNNRDEIVQFLDSSNDIDKLQNKIKIIDDALTFKKTERIPLLFFPLELMAVPTKPSET